MFKTESCTIPHKHKLKIEIGDRKTSIKLLYIWKTTWVTLGKLPWKSKIPLQGNGMAAIPKRLNVFYFFDKIYECSSLCTNYT